MIPTSRLRRLFIIFACALTIGVSVHWALANSSPATAKSDEDALWAAVGGLDAQFSKSDAPRPLNTVGRSQATSVRTLAPACAPSPLCGGHTALRRPCPMLHWSIGGPPGARSECKCGVAGTTVPVAKRRLAAHPRSGGTWGMGSGSARISVRLRPAASGSISFTPVVTIYLPLIAKGNSITQEVRALWVTRFEWTSSSYAVTTTDLDAIVDNAAAANFNMLLFQIRGTADAFYPSTLEPWSARMTGSLTRTLGQDPGWDPLAYMITRAHAKGLQVHAYMNVYPTWICGYGAPPHTTPEHLFWTLSYSTAWNTWRVWDDTYTAMNLDTCGSYLWATPALSLTNQHIVAVAVDLAARYDLDGIHLDNVRYPGSNYSFDPFTQQAFTNAQSLTPALTFAAWQPDYQRAQVNNLVAQIYSATTAIKPDLWVSAAVWPFYSSGSGSYFQDSKGWLAAGSVDANMPMLYAGSLVTDVTAWTAAAQDFINSSYGRYVIPGIGVLDSTGACVPFDQLQARIDAARSMNAPGVVFFSYSSLVSCGYLNALAGGPFATPASVPKPAWKPEVMRIALDHAARNALRSLHKQTSRLVHQSGSSR